MNEIQIGSQIWSTENATITTFRNGDDIPFVSNITEWNELSSPAYSINDNNDYLYNYWVIVDSRNIAPTGWRIPNDNDWNILINFANGNDVAGHKLKSINGWTAITQNMEGVETTINVGGTDEFGFNAKPTGFRHMDGNFALDLLSPYFTQESIDENLCKYVFLFSGNEFGKGGMWKKDGFPIRLIKE
jgi:uncharacterized protein (TIGR02145 family)